MKDKLTPIYEYEETPDSTERLLEIFEFLLKDDKERLNDEDLLNLRPVSIRIP